MTFIHDNHAIVIQTLMKLSLFIQRTYHGNIHNSRQRNETLDEPSLAASFAAAVSDELVPRTVEAARMRGRNKVCVCGGVAANSRIRTDLTKACKENGLEMFAPPLKLCGDNGSMIACQAYYEYLAGNVAKLDINGYANMKIS